MVGHFGTLCINQESVLGPFFSWFILMICQMTCPQILNYLLSIYLSPFRYLIKISRSNHPEVFCEKGVLGNSTKFKGKHLCQGLFFNKVKGLRAATLLKKRLWHRCFPVNFAKLLRNLFLQNISDGCFWISTYNK